MNEEPARQNGEAWQAAELAARLADREARHQAALSKAARVCRALEGRVLELEAALREAEQKRAAETATAADHLARRHEEFTTSLARAARARDTLSEELSAARTALTEAAHTRNAEAAAAAERLARLASEREELQRWLASTQADVQRLSETLDEERQHHERDRAEHAGALERISSDLDQARESVEQMSAAFQTLERVSSEHAEARARLEGLLAEREAELSTQAAAQRASEDAAAAALALARDELARALEANSRGIAQREQEIDTLRRELERTRLHAERVQLDAERVPALLDEIEKSREEARLRRDAEARLRKAQRIEAVGRLASEVAATCASLLRDAVVNGRPLLAAGDHGTPERGEQVLEDLTRAAGYLQQLNVYGVDRTSDADEADVTRILGDMQPVLSEIAGEKIELALPQSRARLLVDVEPERVERVLVNVAAYARARMPHGGRVLIDLASIAIDDAFVARHPSVRPGQHVLITVSEARVGDDAGSVAAADADCADAAAPGMDLGALLELVGESGGHVWMAVESPGTMTLKIHLPKRTRRALPAPSELPATEREPVSAPSRRTPAVQPSA